MSEASVNIIEKQVAWAVVPAGGSGKRFFENRNSEQQGTAEPADKLMVILCGLPVLVHTLRRLLAASTLSGVVVAAHPERVEAYQALFATCSFEKPVLVVPGAETRRGSVCCALKALPKEVKVVAVHDAARPLVAPKLVDQAVQRACETRDSVLVAVRVRDTLKQVEPTTMQVERTLDRETLWRAQTPQVFLRGVLMTAHEAVAEGETVTDDVQLLELSGLGAVTVIEGHESNMKITTREDLALAERLMACCSH